MEKCDLTLGTRYPTLAFISGGAGQATDGIPPQPFETFCYDSALLEAKIENFNVVPHFKHCIYDINSDFKKCKYR